jgi:hypothetical protein
MNAAYSATVRTAEGTNIITIQPTKLSEVPASPSAALFSTTSPERNSIEVTVEAAKMLNSSADFSRSGSGFPARNPVYSEAMITVRGNGWGTRNTNAMPAANENRTRSRGLRVKRENVSAASLSASPLFVIAAESRNDAAMSTKLDESGNVKTCAGAASPTSRKQTSR